MNDSSTEKLLSPRRRWWRDVMLGIALFMCGAIVGASAFSTTSAASRERGPQRVDMKRAMRVLARDLDMTEEQVRATRHSLREGMMDLRDIRSGVQEEVIATLERVREEVAAELDESQREAWYERFDRMKRRMFPNQRVVRYGD